MSLAKVRLRSSRAVSKSFIDKRSNHLHQSVVCKTPPHVQSQTLLGFSSGAEETKEVPKSGDPAAPLHLVTFTRLPRANVSCTPFGGKIEAVLQMAGIEHSVYLGTAMNCMDKSVAPKQKFPVLYHGGNVIPDSSAIVDYLTNTYPKEMAIFQAPDPKTKALALSVQRMLEEHTYFAFVYCLWQREDVCYEYCPKLLQDFPSFLRGIFVSIARSGMVKSLHGQGMGRHSFAEVKARMAADLDVCATLLEDSGQFLTGSTPCPADCFLFAAMDTALKGQKELKLVPAHVAMFEARPALMAFYERLLPRLFPEGSEKRWKGAWNAKVAGKIADKKLA